MFLIVVIANDSPKWKINSLVVWLAIKNYFVLNCFDNTIIRVIYLQYNILLRSVKQIYIKINFWTDLLTSKDSDKWFES